MMRAFNGIALGSLLLLAGSIVASGQGGSAQPNGFTNLQVWPVDTPRAVVLNFMNAFNRSLGVECNYCHVQRDGTFDFASDERREKRVARKMILFRDSINVQLAAIVDKPVTAGPTSVEARPGAPTRVLCASCHHGLPIPAPLGEVISEAEKGDQGSRDRRSARPPERAGEDSVAAAQGSVVASEGFAAPLTLAGGRAVVVLSWLRAGCRPSDRTAQPSWP